MNSISPQLIDEVTDLLKASVTDVFSTMLGLEAIPVEPREIRRGDEVFVAASVGFVGDVHGIVYMYLRASLAQRLAGLLLSMDEADLAEDEIVNDAMGELGNMVVGATKSRLCDEGLACTLTIPSIIRGRGLNVQPVCSSEAEQVTLVCGDELVLLELIMKPSP